MFLTPLAALSLIGAGCGGGTKSGESTGDTSASANDPSAILGAVKPGDQAKPAKMPIDLGVTLAGQLTNPQVPAFLGSGPFNLQLSGPFDPTCKPVDTDSYINASAAMGSNGMDELKWLKPVYAGETLTGTMTVKSKRVSSKRPEMGILKCHWELFNTEGKKKTDMTGVNFMRVRQP